MFRSAVVLLFPLFAAFGSPANADTKDLIFCTLNDPNRPGFMDAHSFEIYVPHFSSAGDFEISGTIAFYLDALKVSDLKGLPINIHAEAGDQNSGLRISSIRTQIGANSSIQIEKTADNIDHVRFYGYISGFDLPEYASGNCLYLDETVHRPALSGGN